MLLSAIRAGTDIEVAELSTHTGSIVAFFVVAGSGAYVASAQRRFAAAGCATVGGWVSRYGQAAPALTVVPIVGLVLLLEVGRRIGTAATLFLILAQQASAAPYSRDDKVWRL